MADIPIRRKQAWFDVGNMANDLQEDFEEAQEIARNTGMPIAVNLKIVVKCAERYGNNGEFMEIGYMSSVSRPPRKSRAYIGNVERGVLVQIGESRVDALQEQLQLGDRKTTAWAEAIPHNEEPEGDDDERDEREG